MIQRSVLIAELKQETATFNPALTVYEDFHVTRGPDIFSDYRDTETELAGVIEILEADGRFEVVPTYAAAAVSGGPIRAVDLDRLLTELTDSIRKHAEHAAGVCLCLHGAMAGEDEGDPEGKLIREIRSIVGEIPIVVSLDLHAVITDQLIEHADVLVPFHTYPHIDQRSTGRRAARNLLLLIDQKVKPTLAQVKLPMLVRGDELLTSTGKFGEAIRMCQEVENSETGLSAGVIIGNAFTDVPSLQSHVLITTDSDADLAQHKAREIGQFMWKNRELFQATLTPLDVAIRQARETDGLVVFSDAADATASGASGDSNAILEGLLESSFEKRALLSLVDAPAVGKAFAHGVGAELVLELGGTRDRTRFTPIDVGVRVKSLHDGEFAYENGTMGHAGRVAVLASGSILILVTERPVYVVGRRVFEAHGLNPVDFDLVVVKSPNGFRTWYESIASLIVPVDVPGSTSANLRLLPFRNCARPIFPLDEEVPSPFDEGVE